MSAEKLKGCEVDAPKCLLTKMKSLKFTYEVTSDPDSFLCLAVVYVCYEKALKYPAGQFKDILLMLSSQMCGYLKNTFVSRCVLCCTITLRLCDLL